MNINNGKTGTVNIPGALHSTGGDGDGLVGNVVAYAGDVYDENLNANQAEINKSTIKLNEYNEVNVTYPENVEREGYILCNLAKDNERIIQDFSDSDFADSVRDGNFYIATNIGNAGITEDEFNGYILDEEITNVNDSNDKSTILNCFKLNDYWVLETESELTASNNLYSCLGYYNKQHMVTPFKLRSDGSLYLVNVGGYDGDESNADEAQPLQEVLNQIASAGGGVTSWDDLEDKPTILDSYDVRQIVLEKSPLHYDDRASNYVSYFPNGSNDSYTPNTISGTSNSVLIGLYNGFRNTYNGVVLGNNNSTSGNTSHDGDESTVIVGKSNTNASKNSVLIGDSNNNNQNKSVLLGSTNINKSECGVNIGFYNQNNGGERNVMVGYENYASNSANTLCMGSENQFSMYYNSPANQEIIAIGRGLDCRTGGIFLGYYNVQDYIVTGDTANFLTIGDGSGTTYSSTRSNIIEQRRNGDIYIKGVGNYNGNNSRRDPRDPTRGKSLQEVLNQLSTDIQSVSASTGGGSGSDSYLSLDEDKNLLVNEDYITVDGGYNLLYAIDYISYNLSGSSSQYELELYGGYSWKDFHYQLVKFLEDAEILDEDGQTVATITDATYDSSTKNITITTSVDLGELYGNVFYSRNLNIADCCICLGGFLNKGYYANLIGRDNYNTGDDAIAIGNYNTNEGEGCVIVGNSNSIQNEHNGYRCYVFGERNKVNDNSILYVLGQYNESTGDDLQSFGLGDGIKFTRGVNAGNDNLNQAGIGVGLDISQNEFVLGQFNKDYDIADNSQKNFFTVGNGNESTKSNSLEQKVNGDLYVLGLGGFNGANSNVNTTKSLQAKITELENRIAQLESLMSGSNS